MKKYFKENKVWLIGIILLITLRQFLLVFAQRLNANMFDNLAANQFQQFMYTTLYMVVTWAVMIGMDAFLNISEENLSQDIQKSIRSDIAMKMVDSDFSQYKTISQGKYLSWFNNDITLIAQKGIKQYLNFVRGVAGVVFAAITLIQYHWSLLAVTLIGFICMFYIPKLFNHKIQAISREVTKGNEQFVSELEDQLNGYSTFFAFNLLPQFLQKIKLASQVLKQVMMKQVRLDAAVIAVNFSVNVLFQIVLTLVAAYCYFKGWVQIGTVTVAGVLADIIFSELGKMSYQIASIKGVKPIFEKYDLLEKEKIEELSLSDTSIFEANNISLSYEEKEIFDNVSFKIEPSSKCLISGLSGSGKSSLLKIMLGYNKVFSGELLYRGQSTKHLSSKTLAKEIIYLSQEPHIFHGTVQENIELGTSFDDEALLDVISCVGFENAEEILKSTAKDLSGGQKQRIALARALIRKPKIILCDEITSSLDKESAKKIEELLLKNNTLTVVMITHALQSDNGHFDTVIEL